MRLASGVPAGVAVGLSGSSWPLSQSSGVYTATQATKGRAAYERHCAECHLADLEGVGRPGAGGRQFSQRVGRPARQRFAGHHQHLDAARASTAASATASISPSSPTS